MSVARVEFQLTKDEYLRARRWLDLRTPIYWCIAGPGLAFAVCLVILGFQSGGAVLAVPGLIALGTWTLAALFSSSIRWSRSATLRGHRSVEVLESGIAVESDTGRWTSKWATYRRLGVGGGCYHVQQGRSSVLVPVRAFAAPSEERAFVTSIGRHLSPSATVLARLADLEVAAEP